MKKGRVGGQANLIVLIITILLVLTAIIIVWNIVYFLFSRKSDQMTLDPLTVKIDLDSQPIIDGNCVNISIKRGQGVGRLFGISFIFKNESGAQESYIEKDESKLPLEFEKKDFQFCYPFEFNITNVSKVSFIPLFGGGGGGSYNPGIPSGENELVENSPVSCYDSSLNPIPICTCYDLNKTRENLSANYELKNDIDCSDTINWNNGQGWEPIGNGSCIPTSFSGYMFDGSFNGESHRISNLFIHSINTSSIGLFGCSRGNITGVGMENIVIIVSSNTTISVGGLAGVNFGEIKNSYSKYNINATTSNGNVYLGGLVGRSYRTINNTYSIGNIIGGTYQDPYYYMYGMGSGFFVYPASYVGGLVGLFQSGNVTNSYSISNINLTENANIGIMGGFGGLVGSYQRYSESDHTNKSISHSFAVGNINLNHSEHGGGLIGSYNLPNYLKINNVFWNNNSQNPQISCYNAIAGFTTLPENLYCTAIQNNPSYFYSRTNSPMTSWDFENVWQENSGAYPTLR